MSAPSFSNPHKLVVQFVSLLSNSHCKNKGTHDERSQNDGIHADLPVIKVNFLAAFHNTLFRKCQWQQRISTATRRRLSCAITLHSVVTARVQFCFPRKTSQDTSRLNIFHVVAHVAQTHANSCDKSKINTNRSFDTTRDSSTSVFVCRFHRVCAPSSRNSMQ